MQSNQMLCIKKKKNAWKETHLMPFYRLLIFFDNLILFCILLGGEYLLGLYVVIVSIKNKIFLLYLGFSIHQSEFKVYYWIIGPFILMLVYGRESIWVFLFTYCSLLKYHPPFYYVLPRCCSILKYSHGHKCY